MLMKIHTATNKKDDGLHSQYDDGDEKRNLSGTWMVMRDEIMDGCFYHLL